MSEYGFTVAVSFDPSRRRPSATEVVRHWFDFKKEKSALLEAEEKMGQIPSVMVIAIDEKTRVSMVDEHSRCSTSSSSDGT